MIRDEISEYPYSGTVTRVIEGSGRHEDTTQIIYVGVMDAHMSREEVGSMMQTSDYIISMPLTQDENGEWIVPRRGDKIELQRYGETLNFTVDNAEPSQLGGISVYSTRNGW